MARSALVGRIAPLLLALSTVTGCGGKVVHLGCPHANVNAGEVLWIGDSWILVPGGQLTRVQDLARGTGAIGPTDVYANVAAPATNMSAIANQYATQEAGATKVKVLIMDGGTWDTITAQMLGASVPDAATTAAAAFTQLLAQVASDGTVTHVIYFLMPELPDIPGVAVLRPLVQQACAQSTVPCHFLDLQPLWANHPEYTMSGVFFPSDVGARVVGDAIWSIMRDECIAQ